MYRILYQSQSSEWLPAATALCGVAVGALLNHFLERSRHREQSLFQMRRDIYAKILVGMNASFVPKEKRDEFLSDPNFMSKIRTEIGELLSQGRLLASLALSEKFRVLYDSEMTIWRAIDDNKDTDALTTKRALLIKEIENLMRAELGIM